MTAEQLIRAGRLDDALSELQNRVRSQPSDVSLRIFLFQLLALMGQWSRALKQLNLCGELDPSCLAMVQTYRAAIDCEVLRNDVFAGTRTPIILGEPNEWLAHLIHALHLDQQGQHAQAHELRQQALALAPSNPGQCREHSFAWLSDCDPRLGPVLEVINNGRYAWLPLHNVKTLRCEQPSDLRDLIWLPAEIVLHNGGQLVALIPSRYPGSEQSSDDRIRLARLTEFDPQGIPFGQRLLVDEERDYPLFELTELHFSQQASHD